MGCDAADTATHNLKDQADNFGLLRRIIVFHGVTGEVTMEIEGYCSITDQTTQLEVVCEVGRDKYYINYVRLGDNTEYLVEQLEPITVSTYHYVRRIRPQTAIPDIVIDIE